MAAMMLTCTEKYYGSNYSWFNCSGCILNYSGYRTKKELMNTLLGDNVQGSLHRVSCITTHKPWWLRLLFGYIHLTSRWLAGVHLHCNAVTLHSAGYTVHESCTWTLHLTNQPNLTKHTLTLLNTSHKPLDGVRQPALPSAQPCDAQPRPPFVPDLKKQTRPSPHPTVNKHTHSTAWSLALVWGYRTLLLSCCPADPLLCRSLCLWGVPRPTPSHPHWPHRYTHHMDVSVARGHVGLTCNLHAHDDKTN